jgi:hypothetical protein
MSTQKKPVLTITRNATATITAHVAVTLLGAIAAAGSEAAGFAVNDAAIGENFPVDVLGTSTGVAGAAVDAGDPLEIGTGGKVVPQTTGARIGYAMFDAGIDAPVEVLIDKSPAPPAEA